MSKLKSIFLSFVFVMIGVSLLFAISYEGVVAKEAESAKSTPSGWFLPNPGLGCISGGT